MTIAFTALRKAKYQGPYVDLGPVLEKPFLTFEPAGTFYVEQEDQILLDDLKPGYYKADEAKNIWQTQASTYLAWLDELAALEPTEDFSPLLTIGALGPKTSARLAKRLTTKRAAIAAAAGQDPKGFMVLYDALLEGLTMASDDGLFIIGY